MNLENLIFITISLVIVAIYSYAYYKDYKEAKIFAKDIWAIGFNILLLVLLSVISSIHLLKNNPWFKAIIYIYFVVNILLFAFVLLNKKSRLALLKNEVFIGMILSAIIILSLVVLLLKVMHLSIH